LPKIALMWGCREEQFNLLSILSTIIFPQSESQRQALNAESIRAWLKSENSDRGARRNEELSELAFGVLEALPENMPGEQSIGETAARQFGRGRLAGLILVQLLRLAKHAPGEHDSLGKAKHLVERELVLREQKDPIHTRKARARKARAQGKLVTIPSSPDSLKDAWSKFRSVSHFHGALVLQAQLASRSGGTNLERPREGLIPRSEMLKFLVLAKTLGEQGQKHRSERASEPTLPQEIWTAPTPYRWPAFRIDFRALEPDELESLQNYHPDLARSRPRPSNSSTQAR